MREGLGLGVPIARGLLHAMAEHAGEGYRNAVSGKSFQECHSG